MSRSRRKTPIFGHAGKSEKKDKQMANRIFRKKTKDEIAKGNYENLPFDINQALNVWSMSKDGKSYWKEGKTIDGGKHMRK
jgi:hypothetical protein